MRGKYEPRPDGGAAHNTIPGYVLLGSELHPHNLAHKLRWQEYSMDLAIVIARDYVDATQSLTAHNLELCYEPRPTGAAHIFPRVYASSFFTRSGVNGECRSRTPVSSMIALETAGAINGVAICPAPVGWLLVLINSICISGTSFIRGKR